MSERGAGRADSGLSLVELLLSMAILTMVMVIIAGTVFAAQSSTKMAHIWGDRTEQLRVSINQIGEDVTYGHWCSCSPGGGNVFRVAGWQAPQVDTTGWNQDWEGWPGYFQVVRSVVVEYRLEGGLKRTVYDGAQFAVDQPQDSLAYSSQVLSTDVQPYSSTAVPDRSYFEIDTQRRLVSVVLRTLREEAGVNRIAEVIGQWYLPWAPG